MQKAKERYSKENAAEYYLENKEAIKKNSWDRSKTCQKKKKTKEKEKEKEKEYRVPKKKISATDSVQKRSIRK